MPSKVSSYNAQYLVFWVVQCALHLIPSKTLSIKHHLSFTRKTSATLQLMHEDYCAEISTTI